MKIKRYLNPYTAFAMGSVVILALLAMVTPPNKNGKGGPHLKNSNYVTFDTVKYVNSRREMTARLLGENEAQKQEAISVLTSVEKSTRPAIEKHAKGQPPHTRLRNLGLPHNRGGVSYGFLQTGSLSYSAA